MFNFTDYMNSKIIERHDHHMELNASTAETANFILSLTSILSESDKVWYTELKKSSICYDV
jgi:hypothetical protein